ncbi:MAG: hypothetical protein Q9182_004204 [Xanthomendoza sp. 2 TL-2023]
MAPQPTQLANGFGSDTSLPLALTTTIRARPDTVSTKLVCAPSVEDIMESDPDLEHDTESSGQVSSYHGITNYPVTSSSSSVQPNELDADDTINNAPEGGHQQLERTDTVPSTDGCDQSGLTCEDFDLFEQEICRNTQEPPESDAKIQMDNGPRTSASSLVSSHTAPTPQAAKDIPGSSSIGPLIKPTDNPASPSPCPSPWSLESRGIEGDPNIPCPLPPPTASLQVDTAKDQRSKSLPDFDPGSFNLKRRGGITLGAAPALPMNKEKAAVSNPIRRDPDSELHVSQPISSTATAIQPAKLNKKGQQWARLLAYGAVSIQASPVEASEMDEAAKSGLLHTRGAIGTVVASNGKGSKKGDRPRRSRPTTPPTRPMPRALKYEPDFPPSPTSAPETPVSNPAVPCAQGLATVTTPVPQQAQSVTTVKDNPIPDVVSKESSTVTEKITAESNVEPRPSAPRAEQIPRATVAEDTISNAGTTNVPIPEKKSEFKLLVWPPSSARTTGQLPPAATKPTTSAQKPLSKPMRPREHAPKQSSPLKEVQTASYTDSSPATKEKAVDLTPAATDVHVWEQVQAKPAAEMILPATSSSAPATEPVLKPDAPLEEASVSVPDQARQAPSFEGPPLKDTVETPLPAEPCKLKLAVEPRASTPSADQVCPSTPPPQNLEKSAGPTTPGPKADPTPAPNSTPLSNCSFPGGVLYASDLPPAIRGIGLRVFRNHAGRQCKSRQPEPDMMEIDDHGDSDDDINEHVNEPVKVDSNGDVEMVDVEMADVEMTNVVDDSGYGTAMDIDTDLNSDGDPMDIDEDPPARVFREPERPVKYRSLKMGSLEWYTRCEDWEYETHCRHMA